MALVRDSLEVATLEEFSVPDSIALNTLGLGTIKIPESLEA